MFRPDRRIGLSASPRVAYVYRGLHNYASDTVLRTPWNMQRALQLQNMQPEICRGQTSGPQPENAPETAHWTPSVQARTIQRVGPRVEAITRFPNASAYSSIWRAGNLYGGVNVEVDPSRKGF
jgi:hypothetical protein